jgi:short-subunit dehydrogenase
VSNVLITGASAGIGRATALAFARRGDRVGLLARRADRLAAVAGEIERAGGDAVALPGDVRREDDLREAFDAFARRVGPLDILVANAGIGIFSRVAETPLDEYRAAIETDFLGVVAAVRCALPGMLERRKGSLVLVGSICGRMGYSGMSAYCAAKFALAGFAQALRAECRGTGVRVSLVNPGSVQTAFLDGVRSSPAVPAAERIPSTLEPEAVARAVVRAADTGRREIILPALSRIFIRFHDLAPQWAEDLFETVSRRMKGRSAGG